MKTPNLAESMLRYHSGEDHAALDVAALILNRPDLTPTAALIALALAVTSTGRPVPPVGVPSTDALMRDLQAGGELRAMARCRQN